MTPSSLPRCRPRQWWPPPNGDVLAALAADPVAIGIGVARRVAADGGGHQPQPRAGAGSAGRTSRWSSVRMRPADSAGESKRNVSSIASGISAGSAQLVQLRRMGQECVEGVAEQVGGRDDPGPEHDDQQIDHLVVGQVAAGRPAGRPGRAPARASRRRDPVGEVAPQLLGRLGELGGLPTAWG